MNYGFNWAAPIWQFFTCTEQLFPCGGRFLYLLGGDFNFTYWAVFCTHWAPYFTHWAVFSVCQGGFLLVNRTLRNCFVNWNFLFQMNYIAQSALFWAFWWTISFFVKKIYCRYSQLHKLLLAHLGKLWPKILHKRIDAFHHGAVDLSQVWVVVHGK